MKNSNYSYLRRTLLFLLFFASVSLNAINAQVTVQVEDIASVKELSSKTQLEPLNLSVGTEKQSAPEIWTSPTIIEDELFIEIDGGSNPYRLEILGEYGIPIFSGNFSGLPATFEGIEIPAGTHIINVYTDIGIARASIMKAEN